MNYAHEHEKATESAIFVFAIRKEKEKEKEKAKRKQNWNLERCITSSRLSHDNKYANTLYITKTFSLRDRMFHAKCFTELKWYVSRLHEWRCKSKENRNIL